MPTIGQYKGIDIEPGTDEEVRAQISGIDNPIAPKTQAKTSPTANAPLSTLGSYDLGNTYSSAQDYMNKNSYEPTEGGNEPNNMPLFTVVNYIIKT